MGNVNPRGMFHTDTAFEIVADRIVGVLGRQHHVAAGVHTDALARRLKPLVRHAAWDVNDDGKWVRALLSLVLANFGLTIGHVASEKDTSYRAVTWEMLEGACAAVELQLTRVPKQT